MLKMCVICVCMCVYMRVLDPTLPRADEVALGGRVTGQSALIPLPVRVSSPWLLTADGSHVSTLRMSARWRGKSQPGKHITEWPWGRLAPNSPSLYTPLWNNLTCPIWSIVSSSGSLHQVKWLLCCSKLDAWKLVSTVVQYSPVMSATSADVEINSRR